jgi:YggT family protein
MILLRIIDFVFQLLDLALLLRVLFSWIRVDPLSAPVRLVRQITEPILAPLRRYIPPFAGLDITPMIAMILLELLRGLVRSVVVSLLF